MVRVRFLAVVLGMTVTSGAALAEDAPLDPYADETPLDPYADEAPVAVATAPVAAAPAPAVMRAAEPRLEDPYAESESVPSILMAYAPLRVVATMLDTGQALFWDERDTTYRLGKVGEDVHGWRILAVEAERVVVVSGGVRDELVLSPAPTVKKPAGKRKAPATIVVAAPETTAPVEVATAAPAAIPTVTAAAIPTVSAPPAALPAPVASPTVIGTPERVVAVPPTAPVAAAPQAAEYNVSLSRAELDAELTDLDRLMLSVQVTQVPGGGFKLTQVDEKSYVYKIGLRAGDTVLSVGGEQVTTIDDAARVYARLRTAKTFIVEVDRSGQRVSFHYAVK